MGAHGVTPSAKGVTPPAVPDGGHGKPFWGPDDTKDFDPAAALAEPGQYPFARGIHRDMYR